MFILRVSIIALMAQLAPAQAPTGSVEGIVMNMTTNDPVAGADVELTRVETQDVTPDPAARRAIRAVQPTIFRASTTDDGKFVLKNIPEGRYRLVATRAGGTL